MGLLRKVTYEHIGHACSMLSVGVTLQLPSLKALRDVSNRQSMHQPQTVDRAQGGGHRAAISAHVVRFDVQRLPAGHIPSVHPPRQMSEKATSQFSIYTR
jgi:hypothetical protein